MSAESIAHVPFVSFARPPSTGPATPTAAAAMGAVGGYRVQKGPDRRRQVRQGPGRVDAGGDGAGTPVAAFEETETRLGPSEIAGEQHDWIIVNAQ